ncbi:hypothetical protein Tco_0800318 [Tanacetum coccineum]|uniref:Uncharacterized protein n=1 Tax=Tanacetum coccineum TaxID=301880 RepID=A0ABQ4ZTR7_9ASTR
MIEDDVSEVQTVSRFKTSEILQLKLEGILGSCYRNQAVVDSIDLHVVLRIPVQLPEWEKMTLIEVPQEKAAQVKPSESSTLKTMMYKFQKMLLITEGQHQKTEVEKSCMMKIEKMIAQESGCLTLGWMPQDKLLRRKGILHSKRGS